MCGVERANILFGSNGLNNKLSYSIRLFIISFLNGILIVPFSLEQSGQ